ILEELRAAYSTWRAYKAGFQSVSDWWEYVKLEFRFFFQAKSQQQACLKRRDFRRLQRELRSLQDLLRCGWDVREELEETKRSLKRHFEEESERIVFRSKVENLEKGEKCNSFFFRKLHAGHTPMNELRDESGNMRRGKENVMKVVSDFYSELYARKTTDPEAADKFLSELFAEAIRRNGEIRGITAPGPERFEVKCSLYMDDVTVFCADRRSVDTLVQTCETFGRASGAKVNCGKSEAMLFGDWQPASSAPFPFSIQPDFIKVLGVWFGKEGAALKSWEERLTKITQRIGLWSLRRLTCEGKALVLRNEVLPVLQYTAQAWPPPATVCRAITRTVFRFVWGSKMDRVKRSIMYKDPRKGGKGVPDIPTLLRSSFVCDCVRRTLRVKRGSAGGSMSRFFLLPLWRRLGWDKWDSSFPYNWTAPWFYGDVVRFVREHQLEGLKPDLWKPKTIHKLIRAKDEMENIPGLHHDTLETVWTNVSSAGLTNGHKDLSWMAIQGGLPVRSFMHARNLCKTRYCPRCPFVEETSLHAFWDCRFAQRLLVALEDDLRNSVPRGSLSYHSVLYGLFPGTHTVGAIQEAWRLMNCFKDAIWILEELRAAYSTWRAYKAGFQSVSDWWEYVKLEFRFFFQAKSQQQAGLKRRDFRRLQRELRSLQDLLRCGWDVREELEETKRSLKRHFEEESERIVFRSKVENLEKGEKCNSFFFRKLHAGHTPMNELRDESGSMRRGKENVMKVVSDFYSELYARKTTDPEAADKFLSELFAEAIRRNGEIRGITAPGPERFEVKCSLYMDDVTVFCADRRSVDTLVQTCETFGRASGAKVNCGKSEAMLFGDWQPASSAPFPFSIQPDFIKVLGVWFGKEGAALKSWEERLTKITQRIGLWSLRRLTCEGKALVLRNEVLPVLQYTAQAWPPLATVCRAITRTVFRFVWGSKMDRVKRSIMYKDPRKGGKGILEELRAAYSTWRAYKAGFQSVSDWWEYVKLEFRFFFQAKSQQQACLKRRDFRRLQRELRSLQDLLRCGWDVREELEETKRSLKRHFEEESERIVFRSKVENLEKGEKCNSFFFRKLHAGHTPMNELRDESGNMRRGKENVMKVVSDFYSELYARKTTDPEAADKFLSELFAEAIRRNGEIRGITAPGPERFEVKCSLYMDDVTVFCADRRSVDTLVQTCETFGRASGAKVNCGKSEAMLFGDWQPASSAPFPFSIQPDFIKVLGVWFGKEGAALKSWEERLTKITQRIGLWSLRRLTCEGKALVLRNEVLPVLQYTAQAWPPLATVCRAITRTVFRFVWGSKMDRVKRSIMYKDPRK
ncbi:LOW QUALITY PROTEIN: uncharacterized protein ACNLHF_004704, partial [Anomaloglossus baeobatrachus]